MRQGSRVALRCWIAALSISWLQGCTAGSAGGTSPLPPTPPPEPPSVEAGVAPTPGEYTPEVDVLHYDLEIALSDTSDTILGEATLTALLLDATVPFLRLDFSGLAVTEVAAGQVGQPLVPQPLPTAAAELGPAGKLLVQVPPGMEAEDTLQIRVRYGGRPVDGLILGKTVHGEPSAFADNWPNRARFWFPSVDHPSDKATVAYTVHVPPRWQVIATGHQVAPPAQARLDALGGGRGKRTWRWESRVPIPTYSMVLGATAFRIWSEGTASCGAAPASPRADGCIDVTSWVFPQDVAYGEEVFDRAPEMVDFFTRTIGPFPYEKLANVQSATRFGGMENSSAIFYSQLGMARGLLSESTVSHEIAHQWFGDAVTEADWHHLWLSEGFATYFGDLYFEEAVGPEDFQARMEESRQGYLTSDLVDRPIFDREERSLFALLNANNYLKGGWVLHMLRGVMGDEAFFRGIQEYYRRHVHQSVLTEDFQRVMEEVAGTDLDWFFHQWIYQPGYPMLGVEWSWDEAEGEISIEIRQEQRASWPSFVIPLEIEILTEDGPDRRRVEVRERSNSLRLELRSPPRTVVLDPDGWVLKEMR